MAVFCSPNHFHVYHLPFHVTEQVVVATHFSLKPLLPVLNDGRFFVLALSQNERRLVEGTRYSMHKHVQMVRSAQVHETPFRSPQLTLFDLDGGGWILYWKTPDRVKARRKRHMEGIVQLPLFEFGLREKAVGAEDVSGRTSRHPDPSRGRT